MISVAQWPLWRGVVWLKRLALAAESVARSQATLVDIERQRTPARRAIRPMELGTADFTETERQWRIDRGEEV